MADASAMRRLKSSLDSGSRSSLFLPSSSDKRNLWWTAFRKTVLEPHNIFILENPATERIPETLLSLVDEKCQNLERHEEQALTFVNAVGSGCGFGTSSMFPPDAIPALPEKSHQSRCLDAVFEPETTPARVSNGTSPSFELPLPRPSLVSGFSREAFNEDEFKGIPRWLTAVGTQNDYTTRPTLQRQAVYSPYLVFERTWSNAKHELESAINHCAMSGSAALKSIKELYDLAGDMDSSIPYKPLVVFSCTIDNDLGIINHHWLGEDGTFFAAPLCKFDFRDLEHFMHFLAWIEAIDDWAVKHLLPDVLRVLRALANRCAPSCEYTQALPSPVTDAEKQEMQSHSMKLGLEDIPWKIERSRKTPLGVTAAMRMRSQKVQAEPGIEVTPIWFPPEMARTHEKQYGSANFRNENPLAVSTSLPSTPAASSDSKYVPQFLETSAGAKCDSFPQIAHPSPDEPLSEKKKGPPTSLLFLRSAGFTRSATTSPIGQRPATSTGIRSSRSTTTTCQAVPTSQIENNKSSQIVTSTIDIKSPSRSIMSIQSKKSFISLRSAKTLKSPHTPDSSISPRGTGFKTKISSGIDAIREHTKPKRNRIDNSAPPGSRYVPALPTPAYDKKRFDIRAPTTPTPSTPTFFANHQPAHLAKSNASAAATAAYDANHVLPFRTEQYSKDSTAATIKTTITAG